MELSEQFTVIGEDDDRMTSDLAKAPAASVVVFDSTLFEELELPWKKGDEVGVLHGVAIVTPTGDAICTLTFRFGTEDTIISEGVLPIEGASVGHGVITVNGGTGKYRGRGGQVRVETQNPKRYTFEP